MEKLENKAKLLKNLEFLHSGLEEHKLGLDSKKFFNFGMGYGLLFGILGNILVTSIFEYIKDNSNKFYLFSSITISIFIFIILILVIKDNLEIDKKREEIQNWIFEVLDDRDSIENGDVEPNQKILDKHLNKLKVSNLSQNRQLSERK